MINLSPIAPPDLKQDNLYDQKISALVQPYKNREYYTQEQNGFSAHGLSIIHAHTRILFHHRDINELMMPDILRLFHPF
jgi:hypothetical protein